MTIEPIEKEPTIVVNEEPTCYHNFIFIVLLIIICICIILPLGLTSNTYKHNSHYASEHPNTIPKFYYPTSFPSSFPTNYLRH
jgi:hypothetical protein